jgi:hypothetical protein
MLHRLVALLAALAAPALPSCAETSRPETPTSHREGASSLPTGAELSRLLDLASAPTNTPERRAARDRLFREHVPVLEDWGREPSPQEAAAILRGVGDYPCAARPLHLREARLLGETARVSVGGSRGGCTLLMRREPKGWRTLMALGWTVGG